jgi:hypothetical protein
MEARPDELELLDRPCEPDPDPALGVIVEEADPGLFEGGVCLRWNRCGAASDSRPASADIAVDG